MQDTIQQLWLQACITLPVTCTVRNCHFFTQAFITICSSCKHGIGRLRKLDIVLLWFVMNITSVKRISIRVESLSRNWCALSPPWETPLWRMTPRLVSIQLIAVFINLWSLFHHFFSFCRSPVLNDHSGDVANCDHTSEWIDCVHMWIGIWMR